MDVLSGGLNEGNILVTSLIIVALLFASSKAKILDKAGIIAAGVLGTLVGILGHWTWLVVLLGFLLTSHKATKWRFDEKKEKGLSESDDGHRGWGNVLANGGMPALVAIYAFYTGDWANGLWLFSAAVAVASSDTFASEIGCMDDDVRMITTFKKCEPGINGGYSILGQEAALAGGYIIGTLAFISFMITSQGSDLVVGLKYSMLVGFIGFFGCQVDSYLGAIFENRGYLTKGGVNALAITSGVAVMWFILNM